MMRESRILLLGLLALLPSLSTKAAYDPDKQPDLMQYFTPLGGAYFVGDCIPFAHNGTYYLYWLLDEGHHSALGGLGGHQWCLSTTTDLVHSCALPPHLLFAPSDFRVRR